MPNALMEALAVGVPSISTDCPCGGPRELIEQNTNGLLVRCNDETSLSYAMDVLLANPQQVGKNAREMALNYKPEVIMRQWEKFIFSRGTIYELC